MRKNLAIAYKPQPLLRLKKVELLALAQTFDFAAKRLLLVCSGVK
jgi:hypothetical protein